MRIVTNAEGDIIMMGDMQPGHGIDISDMKLPDDFIETACDGKYKWLDGKAVAVKGWTPPVPPVPQLKDAEPTLEQRLAALETEVVELKRTRLTPR